MSGTDIGIIAVIALQLVVVFGFVLVERRQPSATLAWVLSVMLVPVVGAVLYFGFGLRRTIKRSRAALMVGQRIHGAIERHDLARKKTHGLTPADELDHRTKGMLELGARAADALVSDENRVTILHNARATYQAMIAAIEQARHHVHVLFYIVQPDETGRALRDLLVRRATSGIEVRVLCDAIGSFSLPGDFWDPLIAAGGRASYFAPVRILSRVRRRDHINYRNHRKVVVVDGEIGFTGGINVGREYLGLDPEIGEWRDTHIRLEGPSVLNLQQTFIEDWLSATGELVDDPDYFPSPREEAVGSAIAQVVASGPDRPWAVIHRLYDLALTYARERVWIANPYFVPDRVIQNAIVTAALRGLDVRVLVPRRSDSRLVDLASRSYYGELLEAGVRIFQYDRGFLHAKTLVVDDWVGSIGSANMDIRSFHLNYELNVFVYGRPFVDELAAHYLVDLESATELPPDWARKLRYRQRLTHGFAGLLSPLL